MQAGSCRMEESISYDSQLTNMKDNSGELAFSNKYNQSHSEACYKKHKQGLWRDFSNKREIAAPRFTLWVDGNYQAWRRKRLEAKRTKKGYQNRFVVPVKVIEEEFRSSGFKIRSHHDMAPYISMWRIYLLEK